MGRIVGEIEKQRLLPFLRLARKFDGIIGDGVCRIVFVFRVDAYGFRIRETRVFRLFPERCESFEQAVEVFESAVYGSRVLSEVPFAGHGRVVAVGAQRFGDGQVVVIAETAVTFGPAFFLGTADHFADTDLMRIKPCHQAGA